MPSQKIKQALLSEFCYREGPHVVGFLNLTYLVPRGSVNKSVFKIQYEKPLLTTALPIEIIVSFPLKEDELLP